MKPKCIVCGEDAIYWVFGYYCISHVPGVPFRETDRLWGLEQESWDKQLKKWIHAGWIYFYEWHDQNRK